MKSNRLTIMVLLAMVLGVVVGYLVHTNAATPETAKDIAGYFGILTDVFLRMIKMIIAPLVFATLVAGLANMGDAGSVGRVGGRALGWFIAASFCSLFLGLVFANVATRPRPDRGASHECREPGSEDRCAELQGFHHPCLSQEHLRGHGHQ